MATFSAIYNPDQSGAQGFERGFEDYDMLDESCQHDRHTLNGIEERADCMAGPYGSRALRDAYRLELLADAVATMPWW